MAAEPKGSAISVLDWQLDRATLTDLQLGATDNVIVDIAGNVAKLGIDCALGWPIGFARFISAQVDQAQADLVHGDQSRANQDRDNQARDNRVRPWGQPNAPFSGDLEFRRRLAYRETDRQIRSRTGRWPLSVSTDRLAMTAIRAAGLMSQLASVGIDAARSGTGLVVEVYPAASLRQWGFYFSGYRASTDIRGQLLKQLEARAPWLDVAAHRDALIESCDAFDSLVAALATRAAQLGRYFEPSREQLELARLEGWIALPNSPLETLIEPHAGQSETVV